MPWLCWEWEYASINIMIDLEKLTNCPSHIGKQKISRPCLLLMWQGFCFFGVKRLRAMNFMWSLWRRVKWIYIWLNRWIILWSWKTMCGKAVRGDWMIAKRRNWSEAKSIFIRSGRNPLFMEGRYSDTGFIRMASIRERLSSSSNIASHAEMSARINPDGARIWRSSSVIGNNLEKRWSKKRCSRPGDRLRWCRPCLRREAWRPDQEIRQINGR